MKIRKKHRRKLFILTVAYAFLWMSVQAPQVFGAASGNYTDLLPIGAAGNTTVISNGSGWSLTTLAPSQTFGDALSRAPYTPFQMYISTGAGNSTVVSTFTALVGASNVGSATFPATWVAAGRSIRISIKGKYNTTGTPNWTWGVLLGTTTILTTGVIAAPTSQTNQWISATANLTISTVGASGFVIGTYDILCASAAFTAGNPNVVSYSTYTNTPIAVDLTTQLIVRPTLLWGTASLSNIVTPMNVTVEFLN